MFETAWENEAPLRFKTMEDLIGHFICGHCYKEFQAGVYPSIRKTPCGSGLSRIKEVEDRPVIKLPCGCEASVES